MKKLVSFLLLFSCVIAVSAENFKKLNLTVKSNISKESNIYVEPIDNDKLLFVSFLKSSLEANNFKLVSDRKEASYVISAKYKYRNDTGCGGFVLKEMYGQMLDIKNGAEIIAEFSFSQSGFEGKCTCDILSALVKKMKEESK